MNVLQLIAALCENAYVISIVPNLNSFTSCFGLLLNPNANTKKSKQRLMADFWSCKTHINLCRGWETAKEYGL